ncbi:MAG: hypothetical protein HXM47_03260, partial [Pseudoleptotrichia goodfellowii]|nr:hypothetical protein [Pseudoleptotrichia goodfellowii]
PEKEKKEKEEKYITKDIIAVKYTVDKPDSDEKKETEGIKIGAEKRRIIYEYFQKKAKEKGEEFKKKAFRSGKYMTVGYLEYDYENYKKKIKCLQEILESLRNDEKLLEELQNTENNTR